MADLYPSRQGAQAHWQERQDRVVHGDWQAGAALDAAQMESFRTHGFLVLDDLFAPAEVQLLQDEARALLAAPGRLDAETLIREPGGDDLRSIFAIHAQSKVMARLVADPRLRGIAQLLLGGAVYVHQSRLNYKPGFDGREFYWHSDFETWHTEDGMPRMRALSISVLLAENTANNGPLMLIPGSHRRFLACVGETPADHYRQSLRKQEYGVPDRANLAALVAAHGIVAPTGPAGSLIVFDCNVMHGSNGNITPLPRANAFVVYNSCANQLQAPFGPTAPRPEFIAARTDTRPLQASAGLLEQVAG